MSIFETLQSISATLTPANQAELRSRRTRERSLSHYAILSQVPYQEAPVWDVIIPALGHVNPKGRPIGAALAATGYPESRMNRMLGAKGRSLVEQIGSVIRWLVSHDETNVDLTTLAEWAISDWEQDSARLKAVRDRVGLAYVQTAN
jgi:hypothetical protein